MKITIESPHVRISEKLTQQINVKFNQLHKMFTRIIHCELLLKKENNTQKKFFTVEAKLMVPKELLFATEKAETFETAIDKLIDNLEHQLRRHKEELEEAR